MTRSAMLERVPYRRERIQPISVFWLTSTQRNATVSCRDDVSGRSLHVHADSVDILFEVRNWLIWTWKNLYLVLCLMLGKAWIGSKRFYVVLYRNLESSPWTLRQHIPILGYSGYNVVPWGKMRSASCSQGLRDLLSMPHGQTWQAQTHAANRLLIHFHQEISANGSTVSQLVWWLLL